MTTNRKELEYTIWMTPCNYRIVIKYNNYFHIWNPYYRDKNKIYNEIIVKEELWKKIKKNWVEKRSYLDLYLLLLNRPKGYKSIKELFFDRINELKIEKNY